MPSAVRVTVAFVLAGAAIVTSVVQAHRLAGVAYARGNYAIARWWYGVAALTGSAQAQNTLAALYLKGLGGARDPEAAAELLERASRKGNVQAKFNLAVLHLDGTAVHRDLPHALTLFAEAADAGDLDAAFNLGSLYAYGTDGLTSDPLKALHWYRKAAALGHPSAQFNLGLLYAEGGSQPADLTAAFESFLKAARQSHGKAQLNVGRMQIDGLGVPRNQAEGLIWLHRALLKPETASEALEAIKLTCGQHVELAQTAACLAASKTS